MEGTIKLILGKATPGEETKGSLCCRKEVTYQLPLSKINN